jgi:hypothetical protein
MILCQPTVVGVDFTCSIRNNSNSSINLITSTIQELFGAWWSRWIKCWKNRAKLGRSRSRSCRSFSLTLSCLIPRSFGLFWLFRCLGFFPSSLQLSMVDGRASFSYYYKYLISCSYLEEYFFKVAGLECLPKKSREKVSLGTHEITLII